jgi:sarcosine oxidase subunit beta
MPRTHDVAIIGAGVHGASAAYQLARRGVSTVVFERDTPAAGPTGQASGIVRSYYSNPFLAEVSRDSIDFLAEFEDRTGGGDSGYHRTGGLYLHAPEDAEHVAATGAALLDLGIANQVLSRELLAAHFPSINLDGVGIGVWEGSAGYADPARTAVHLASAAVHLGAELHSHSTVTWIEDRADSVHIVVANGSEFEVGRLLIAAGPWTRSLLSHIGVGLPLTAERHVVAGLQDGDEFAASAPQFVLVDVAGGYYARPLDRDQFLLGPIGPTPDTDPDNFSRHVTNTEFRQLAGWAAARVPSRAHAVPATSWASVFDVSPDRQPVIGQVSEHVFVDAGTSGHGFTLAPALGDHVARLLLDEPDPRLAQFSPARFAVGAFGAAGAVGAGSALSAAE